MTAKTSQTHNPVGYIDLIRNNSRFRYLWSGQIVSLLGDWFNLIAAAALIAHLTESGAAVGGLFVIRMLAPFLVSPVAGVVADRYSRKRILILTDIVRGFTVIGFLFVREPDQVWLIYLFTGLQMGLSGFFFPARTSILADITEPEELGTANALSGTTWSVMLSFGAALGGLSSGLLGIYPSFIIDALTFFASAMIISRMDYQPPATLQNTDKTIAAAIRQYKEGLAYLRDKVDILIIALHKAASGFFAGGVFQVLQVPIATGLFVMGTDGGLSLGLMYATMGVGTGLGPIAARHFTADRDRPLRIAIFFSYAVTALGLASVATLASFPIVLIGTLFIGIGAGVGWVFSTQLLLQHTPGHVQGRVFSTEFMMLTLMQSLSAGLGGVLLDAGITISSLLLGLACLILLPASFWAWWIFMRAAEQQEQAISSTMD
jgi:MFS family permease